MMIDPCNACLYFPVFLAVGIWGLVISIRHFIKWYGIQGTPTSRIADVGPGPVEIEGRTYPLSEGYLVSPLAGKECLRYCVRIYRSFKDSEGKGFDKEVGMICGGKRFLVGDGSGYIFVEPGKKLDGMDRVYRYGMTQFDPPENLRHFLESNRIRWTVLGAFHRQLTIEEYILKDNVDLYILGTARIHGIIDKSIPGLNPCIIQPNRRLFISQDTETRLNRYHLKRAVTGLVVSAICLSVGTGLMIYLMSIF